jgi:DNA-directed RNA polymerase subunit RPC12/RpoP
VSEGHFDLRCPMCDSRDWHSVEKDENGVNQVICCNQCGTRRIRRPQEPRQ